MPTEQKTYQYPECGLHYTNKETAKKCEAWYDKYKSYNLEITKNSMEANGVKKPKSI